MKKITETNQLTKLGVRTLLLEKGFRPCTLSSADEPSKNGYSLGELSIAEEDIWITD